jgi:hypothetical protein
LIACAGFDDQYAEERSMASKTKKTEFRRRRKISKAGKKRKAQNRNKGTTKSAKVLFGD